MQTLDALIYSRASQCPDAPAVVDAAGGLDYRRLCERADAVAAALAARRVGPGDVVGLWLGRGAGLIVAMLGVWRVGAAFVLLDAATPARRLAEIVAGADIRCWLHDGDEGPAALSGVAAIDLRSVAACGFAVAPPASPASALACILYTSGSTGSPKAISLSHEGLANNAHATQRRLRLESHDKVLQFATSGVDTLHEEIWPALAAGASVAVYAEGDRSFRAVAAFVARHALSVVDLPTAYWHALTDAMTPQLARDLASIGTVTVGGESPRDATLRRWLTTFPRMRWFNAYGPAEATITSSRLEVVGDERARVGICLGTPLDGVSHRVLDDRLCAVAEGGEGELHIGGAGIAIGYQGRPRLTAERFLPDPHSAVPGRRMYCTGDWVRVGGNGRLHYLERRDLQIKVRGYRVELEDIELALLEYAEVAEAVVRGRRRDDGSFDLVAFVVGRTGSPLDGGALRTALESRLPAFMVPSKVVALSALPLTPGGKLDFAQMFASLSEARPPRQSSLMSRLIAERVRVATERAPAQTSREGEAAGMVLLNASTGERRLFVLHAAGGGVSAYLPLAAVLAPACRVFGLADPDALAASGEDDGGDETLARLAERHARTIVREQPHGQHDLLGWSFGGVVAHAVAVVLRRQGHAPGRVFLIDSRWPQATAAALHRAAISHGVDADAIVDAMAEQDIDKWVPLGSAERTRLRAVYRRRIALLERHRPQRGIAELTYIRAADNDGAETELASWRETVEGGFDLRESPGLHQNLLRAPHVGEIASIVRDALRRPAPSRDPSPFNDGVQ